MSDAADEIPEEAIADGLPTMTAADAADHVGNDAIVLVSGFGGMRDYRGDISFDPRVPAAWDALTFRLTVRGTHVRVRCTHHEITITNLNGHDFECTVQGRPVQVPAGQTVVEELDERARVCMA